MFETICDFIPRDPDYPERTRTLNILTRVLSGSIYDVLPYQFHEERTTGGEYIPLRNRRPSVRYPLSRIVVEDSVSLLFSDGHFPVIECTDLETRTNIANIAREARLNVTLTDAAVRGSVGSVAILFRVLRGRVFFQVMDTLYLTPAWDPQAPDSLISVTERYKVRGANLRASGYPIENADAEYWFCRQWDAENETWYVPSLVGSSGPQVVDVTRSIPHRLGFVPVCWIRNLPGISSTGDPSDGGCTFRAAVETQIEIDYQLSQAGRGLKYSSDPTLLLKEPALAGGDLLKGAGNALVVSEKGDARLLEIGGTASAAVIEYVRTLRELALESVHGNRASPDRLTTAQSGRALEMMNQGLIWLSDNLRVTYGEMALLSLVTMIVRASQIYPLTVMGAPIQRLSSDSLLTLKWPAWYPASADDRQKDAQTLATLATAGHISRETAVKAVASTYDIPDPAGEMSRIASDLQTKGDNV
jgi:hypothetical protein